MGIKLIEFPNEKLKLTFLGSGTYMVWNCATKKYVKCGDWPASLISSICRNRKKSLEGFYIRRGRATFEELSDNE